jgi:hypothetical protein
MQQSRVDGITKQSVSVAALLLPQPVKSSTPPQGSQPARGPTTLGRHQTPAFKTQLIQSCTNLEEIVDLVHSWHRQKRLNHIHATAALGRAAKLLQGNKNLLQGVHKQAQISLTQQQQQRRRRQQKRTRHSSSRARGEGSSGTHKHVARTSSRGQCEDHAPLIAVQTLVDVARDHVSCMDSRHVSMCMWAVAKTGIFELEFESKRQKVCTVCSLNVCLTPHIVHT